MLCILYFGMMLTTDILPSESHRWTRDSPHGTILSFTAKANAKHPKIEVNSAGDLMVYIDARPVDFAANKRAEAIIADWLGLPKSSVRLCRGGSSRYKAVLLPNSSLSP